MEMIPRVRFRYGQVLINLLTIVAAACTFIPLGYVSKDFLGLCVLYGGPVVTVEGGNISLGSDSVWGDVTTCYFTTFMPVVAAIHAFIWCCFFILMKSTLKEENRDSYLLIPSFLFHGVLGMVAFVSSGMVSAGGDSWCHQLENALELAGHRYTCSQAAQMTWKIFQGQNDFYSYLLMAKIASWLMTLTIFGQCFLTGYKLYWIIKQDADSLEEDQLGFDNVAYQEQYQADDSGSVLLVNKEESSVSL